MDVDGIYTITQPSCFFFLTLHNLVVWGLGVLKLITSSVLVFNFYDKMKAIGQKKNRRMILKFSSFVSIAFVLHYN